MRRTAMRGDGMDDDLVGTARRSACAHAEVTLTIGQQGPPPRPRA